MSVLQGKGMTPAAEKELKQLLQLHEKAAKSHVSKRKEKQNDFRVKTIWPKVNGVGLYWFQLYLKEKEASTCSR